MDKQFWVDDKCNQCGICGRVCPSENITMQEGKTGLEPSLRAMFCLPAMVPEKGHSIRQKNSEVRQIPSSRGPVKGCPETKTNTGIAQKILTRIMQLKSSMSDCPLKTRSLRSCGYNYRGSLVAPSTSKAHGATPPLVRCAGWFMLASGFETFPREKTKLFSPPDGFQKTTRHR